MKAKRVTTETRNYRSMRRALLQNWTGKDRTKPYRRRSATTVTYQNSPSDALASRRLSALMTVSVFSKCHRLRIEKNLGGLTSRESHTT